MTNPKTPKQVAVVLFYNPEGFILLQDRRKISKWGEEYGFFGGTVEAGETPKQTIRRELREELELTNVPLAHYKRYTHKNPELNIEVNRSVYLSCPIPIISRCNEGVPEARKFEDSLELKMIPGFNELLREIYSSLISEGKLK